MHSCSRPRQVEGERSSSRALVLAKLCSASRVHNYVGVVVTCSTLTRVRVDVETYVRRPRPLCTRTSQPKKRQYNVKWGEGCDWLQYDDVEGMMFCSMYILQCTIK